MAAYVAAPCAAEPSWTRDPAARAAAAARAAFAGEVAQRCDALSARAARPGFACWAETEAADLPLIPRACTGRAHRTFRLRLTTRDPRSGVFTAAGPLAVAEAVLDTLRALGDAPGDAPGTVPGGPLAGLLTARGFRDLELVRDDRLVGRVALSRDVPRPARASSPL